MHCVLRQLLISDCRWHYKQNIETSTTKFKGLTLRDSLC